MASERQIAECRVQSAECRTTAADDTLQPEKSAGNVVQEKNVKNEPNVPISECRFPNAECGSKIKKEPNSGARAPENNFALRQRTDRKVEDCTTENAAESAERLMEAKMKNEPNLSQVPIGVNVRKGE